MTGSQMRRLIMNEIVDEFMFSIYMGEWMVKR